VRFKSILIPPPGEPPLVPHPPPRQLFLLHLSPLPAPHSPRRRDPGAGFFDSTPAYSASRVVQHPSTPTEGVLPASDTLVLPYWLLSGTRVFFYYVSLGHIFPPGERKHCLFFQLPARSLCEAKRTTFFFSVPAFKPPGNPLLTPPHRPL